MQQFARHWVNGPACISTGILRLPKLVAQGCFQRNLAVSAASAVRTGTSRDRDDCLQEPLSGAKSGERSRDFDARSRIFQNSLHQHFIARSWPRGRVEGAKSGVSGRITEIAGFLVQNQYMRGVATPNSRSRHRTRSWGKVLLAVTLESFFPMNSIANF